MLLPGHIAPRVGAEMSVRDRGLHRNSPTARLGGHYELPGISPSLRLPGRMHHRAQLMQAAVLWPAGLMCDGGPICLCHTAVVWVCVQGAGGAERDARGKEECMHVYVIASASVAPSVKDYRNT